MLRENYLLSSSDNHQKSQLVSSETQWLLLCLAVFCSFETGSISVAPAGLACPTLTRLKLTEICLPLPSPTPIQLLGLKSRGHTEPKLHFNSTF